MPHALNAKFESWAAPLATALLCAARAGPDFELPSEFIELHMRLQRKLLRCLRQPEQPAVPDAPSHRALALKCLRLQLPLLVGCRAAARESVATLEQLFAGRSMQLEISRCEGIEGDVAPLGLLLALRVLRARWCEGLTGTCWRGGVRRLPGGRGGVWQDVDRGLC